MKPRKPTNHEKLFYKHLKYLTLEQIDSFVKSIPEIRTSKLLITYMKNYCISLDGISPKGRKITFNSYVPLSEKVDK